MHSYMITSHDVLQYLNDTEPEMLKSLAAPVYVYDEWGDEGLKDWIIEGLNNWRIEGLKDWIIEY